ncbi:hypothetical protein PAL_GLEAN10016677 [Pteropus alecto]|uniref:Uncharacterized protein n=1 Tax=Pteropus alecto TaxID=9402 RepID=L5L2S3_PTEAL|nr:hypothetical protein PAL_GLEAN10016677 [Pteropus alecto]
MTVLVLPQLTVLSGEMTVICPASSPAGPPPPPVVALVRSRLCGEHSSQCSLPAEIVKPSVIRGRSSSHSCATDLCRQV